MNIVKIKFGFVLLLSLVLTSGLAAQDFIPTTNIYEGNGVIFILHMLEREKLMPHHVAAVKKNGVSLEIHTSNDGKVSYFNYSSEGLLVSSPDADYYYDDKNLLVRIVKISYDSENQIIEFIRDPSGRITSIRNGDAEVTYRYSNGVLQQIGDDHPWSYFKKEKKSHSYKYFYTELMGTFDRFGRWLNAGMGTCGITSFYDKNGRWTGEKLKCEMGEPGPRHLTISYKNGLMKSINDNGNITTIKYEYGHKSESNLKKSYKIR